jgi:transposase
LRVNAPIQYGSKSHIIYFSVYQHIPFGRLKSLFSQVLSLPISVGAVGNILERSAQKCQGFYSHIKTQIAQSNVLRSDETAAKVNGSKWWIWATVAHFVKTCQIPSSSLLTIVAQRELMMFG